MSLIVKICGLSSEETLDAAIDAGADMVGLVFFAPSPRHLTLAHGRALAERARGRAEIVALSVDLGEAGLDDIVAAIKPDWLQLHGREPPELLQALRQRFGLRMMKAIAISQAADLAQAAPYADIADRLIFDARPPKGATRPGGNGAAFDWRLLAGFAGCPHMLSGGLDSGNVAEAAGITGAVGVDVSSGVETAPGRKDPALIRAFVAAARQAPGREPEGAASRAQTAKEPTRMVS